MDIQLEKIRIIQQVAEVDEEWIILSIKKLLGIDDSLEAEEEAVNRYRAGLKPMTKEELIQRALEAEEDIKAGRFVDIETYFNSIEK